MRERLTLGASQMGIALSPEAVEKLLAFQSMLTLANERMNLTRVPDEPAEAVDRNYLDSLAPLVRPERFAHAASLVDVGAGAGFPGIPLSVACPQIHVVLIDSLGKRVAFLQEVISALSLNAEAIHMRAEDAARDPRFRDAFDLATARAVARMNVLCELCLPFVKVGGALLAYKGPSLDEELREAEFAAASLGGRLAGSFPVAIPGRDWSHEIAVVEKRAPTPRRFPRKSGEAGRNPLTK